MGVSDAPSPARPPFRLLILIICSHPIALALDVDDGCSMEQAIDDGAGHHGITEGFTIPSLVIASFVRRAPGAPGSPPV